MKNNTCGNCDNLKITTIMNGRMALASCSVDGMVVPHEWAGETITLWRVPLECPRDDTIKSKKQAPQKDWVKVSVKGIIK